MEQELDGNVSAVADFIANVRKSALHKAELSLQSASSQNARQNAGAGPKYSIGTASVRNTTLHYTSEVDARKAVNGHLVVCQDPDEQELGRQVVLSALEAEAAALRCSPWQYVIPTVSASVEDEATRAERQARDAARSRLVQLLGPALGYTPESAGASHIPRPMRLRRASHSALLASRGPSDTHYEPSTVSGMRPYLYSTGARKANLKWSQAGCQGDSASAARADSSPQPLLTPPARTPVGRAPALPAQCVSSPRPVTTLPRVTLRLRQDAAAVSSPPPLYQKECKDGGESVHEEEEESDSAIVRLSKLLHGAQAARSGAEHEQGRGEEEDEHDDDWSVCSDTSAPGRMQSDVDSWVAEGVVVCLDCESKEREDEDSDPICERDHNAAAGRSRRQRASSAPHASYRDSILRLFTGDTPQPSSATPHALRVWMLAKRDQARRKARRRFHADLAKALVETKEPACPPSIRGRASVAGCTPARAPSPSPLPSPYPADSVRTWRTPDIRIRPVEGALLSDRAWFKLCCVRARQARGAGENGPAGPGPASYDTATALAAMDYEADKGVPFAAPVRRSAVDIALREAAQRRALHSAMQALKRAECRLAQAKAKAARERESSGGVQARAEKDGVQDTSYARERLSLGRPPTRMSAQVASEAHVAHARRRRGRHKRRVQGQALWYASQLHQDWRQVPAPSTASRHQRSSILSELFPSSLPPRPPALGPLACTHTPLPMPAMGVQARRSRSRERGAEESMGHGGPGPAAYGAPPVPVKHVPAVLWAKGTGRAGEQGGPGDMADAREAVSIPPVAQAGLGRPSRHPSPAHSFSTSATWRG